MAANALAILVLGCAEVWSVNDRLKETFSWKQLDFEFPDQDTKRMAIESGAYVQENNVPMGLEVWKDKLFVTVPRWKPGVWSTLNYVSLGNGPEAEGDRSRSPDLIPYPDREHNCLAADPAERIVSVFRASADACDRLWAVDTGVDDLWGRADRLQAASLLVFDLNTGALIRRHVFGPAAIRADSFFANVAADADPGRGCGDAFAYVPDLGASGLVVYSLAADASWRVEHHYFHFDPLAGDYRVAGRGFRWTDGAVGVALSAPDSGPDSGPGHGQRTLYFHPLSSYAEFAVSTRLLRNASAVAAAAATDGDDYYYAFRALGTRGPGTQASGSALDPATGVLFYTQINRDGVGCWNTNADDYSADTNALLASDSRALQFTNDVKVDAATGTLWVLSDRLSAFLYDRLDPGDVNFRVFRAPVADLVEGTVCDVQFR